MIFFTSDWHLAHRNIIDFCNRPFTNIHDMNQTILNNFFKRVHKGDTVYFLGDLTFDINLGMEVLKDISSKGIFFNFIIGGHDKKAFKKEWHKYCFSSGDLETINVNGQQITLCHYPMVSFPGSHYGAWQLYGHHHHDISTIVTGKRLNVGADMHYFQPVSFNDVKAYMDSREDNWDLIKEGK